MNIVIIGGTGLIGRKLSARLRQADHRVLAAAPSSGVNSVTGEGLDQALQGAEVLIDVTNAPSFEDSAVMAFFRASTGKLLRAGRAAGIRHYVALSVVGSERLPESGYFRAKIAQESLIADGPLPYTIVRATQFFEFLDAIAQSFTRDGIIRAPAALLQPMAADDVAAALARVAVEPPLNGLREVHTHKLLHLDIKPANIYVCRKGGEYDFVKVLDFGLARRVDTGGAESRLTLAGEVLGTPQYMAPEAICGREVDGRGDLYSLGCVAYRMLTGHDVFEEPGVMQVLAAHLQGTPRDLRELAPVPDGLAELVMRCLAKEPSDRPSDSAALMRGLEETGLAPRWTLEQAQAWWAANTEPVPAESAPVETVLLQ